jgi:hypothetical protein
MTSFIDIDLSCFTVKAYLRRHGNAIRAAQDPVMVLLEACGCITAEMAEEWFHHAGYII